MKDTQALHPCLLCDKVFKTRGGLSDHVLDDHFIRQRAERTIYDGSPRTRRRLKKLKYKERKRQAQREAVKVSAASQTSVSVNDLHWSQPVKNWLKYLEQPPMQTVETGTETTKNI